MKRINFTVLTKGNLKGIAEALRRKEGRILIARPGPRSWQKEVVDVQLLLFDRPTIELKEALVVPFLRTRRGAKIVDGEPWQGDRDYMLRPAADSFNGGVVDSYGFLFQKLSLDGYEFSVGFQPASGMSLLARIDEITLYVPRRRRLKPAFYHALSQIISMMPEERREKLMGFAEEITGYAMSDLGTGEILKHNVSASLKVDAISAM